MTKTHMVIPDCQVRPGDNLDFLERIGMYIVDKQPDVLINIGDFADMPSLSSYDIGKKSFEGRRYINDIEAAQEGMRRLTKPMREYNERQRKNGKKQYKPQMEFTYGNHCDRITRAVNSDPKLDGTLGLSDLDFESFGWTTHDFLEVVPIDGVCYSHYFVTGVSGRPASTAQVLLNKKHQSCVAGHQQGRQAASAYKADGKRITAIIAGSCYEHDEDYLGPQGNNHWRGLIMLHEVNDGEFDELYVSLDYLKRKYGSN
jgi:hypothetical protein